MLDIAIIGSGPAALSAAVNARQRNKSVCIFGRSLDSSLLFAVGSLYSDVGIKKRPAGAMLQRVRFVFGVNYLAFLTSIHMAS